MRDHAPGKVEIPAGRIEVARIDDWDQPCGYRIEISQADPVVLVAAEFLVAIGLAEVAFATHGLEPWIVWTGEILTIRSTNRDPLIYRQVGYDDQRDCYLFAWPD